MGSMSMVVQSLPQKVLASDPHWGLCIVPHGYSGFLP